MRDVFSTLVPTQSLFAQIALRDAGIEFFMLNANAANWATDVTSPIAPFTIQVREEDFDAAAAVIREALDRIRERPKPESGQEKNS